MYRYLLFDIDDTLLNFQSAQIHAFKKLLTHHHINFSHDLYKTYQDINDTLWHAYEKGTYKKDAVLTERFEQFFKTLNLTVNGQECDDLYRDQLVTGNQLFPDTLSVVQHFSKTHQLAIVTNGVAQTQLARLHNNQLFDYFAPHIFISDTVGFQKPDKRFFEHVFSHMSITDPKEVLIIGDSLHADIYGGNAFGIDTCWVQRPQTAQHVDITPTYTISNLESLFTLNI